MDLTLCPECGEVAEIQWRPVMDSTDGPIEHAKTLCINRHWFLLPVAALTHPSTHDDTRQPLTPERQGNPS